MSSTENPISTEVAPILQDIVMSVEEYCNTNIDESVTSNTCTELDGHLHVFTTSLYGIMLGAANGNTDNINIVFKPYNSCLRLIVILPNIESIDNMKIDKCYLEFNFIKNSNYGKINGVNLRIISDTIRVSSQYEDITYLEQEAARKLYDNWLLSSKNPIDFNFDTLFDMIKKCYNIISKLTIDKYSGLFTMKQINMNNFYTSWTNIVNTTNNIKLTHDSCCVCMEDTKTKTHCCKNHLCVSCWDKIKQVVDQDESYEVGFEIKRLPCPMCRHNLYDSAN